MHFTVRDPRSDALIAFCATYTTYPSTLTSNLLGSLALLLVHPHHRRRGIGTALHDVALAQLRRTPGVEALLLGSAFPRLFAGVPIDAGSKDWFAKRGWRDSGPASEVSDWTVSFDGAPPHSSPVVPGLDFRPCDEGDLGHGAPGTTSGVDTVLLVSLMGACMDRLAQRGMKHMYVDGLRGGDESMQKLGKSPSPLSFLSSLMADGGD
ncbi:hypothetical protein HYQ46_008815 [Verticillium longisporum]|nr:hypothetical protein HYQ46_008815 [Verticillium longisporum]